MTAAAWTQRRERGSAVLVRLMIWLTLGLGWRIGQSLLYPITGYFFLFSRGARSASSQFLARVLERPATRREIFRHLFTFSCVLLDRLFLLSDRLRHFHIDMTGLDTVTSVLAQSRGCILLGSHLGSFEVLRACARQYPVSVNILMYRANNGAYSGLMERLDPTLADAIIEIGTPEAMLRVRESLDRGEMVGILADRAPAGQKMLAVPFLGEPAPLPTGPLSLCAALGAPVVLFYGIRTGARRYEIHFELFAERIVLQRSRRTDDLADWVIRYARRLETYCRLYPFNWFNFYDFWDHGTHAASPSQVRTVAVADGIAAVAAAHGGGTLATTAGCGDRRTDADAGEGSAEQCRLRRGQGPRHAEPAATRHRPAVVPASGSPGEDYAGTAT